MDTSVKVCCRNCHAKLDVSECPPFERVACPQCGTLIRVPMRFERYLLEKICGRGGASVIYRAIEPELARRVAVKIEAGAGSRETLERFINAARLCGKLNHPGIVPIYNCGTFENRSFMVMRFMEHGDLERMMKCGELPGQKVLLSWIYGILPVLIEAKKKNIVHHDIKPSNILLTAENDPKLGDWDLADIREPGDLRTAASEWVSPIYASPERLYCGGEDYRGDIFSLGVTIYELISGKAPFGLEGSAEELYERRESMMFDPLLSVMPGTPPALSELVTGMLDFAPENRPDYEEIRSVIAGVLDDGKRGEEKTETARTTGFGSWFKKK